jgi:hypothetical protein
VSTVTEYTLSEMILLAAHKLEEQGQSPFSAEELIVASWRQFPRSFGLKGYAEQYPDSNRVLSSIMGEKGLTKKGWLSKMGQKLYALSKDGKRVVQHMMEGGDEFESEEEESLAARLPREQERLLLGLLDSSAAGKIVNKKAYELSFADACRFWGITDSLSPEALDARLERVEGVIDQAEKLTTRDTLEVGNREITRSDIEVLREVHDQLQERFSRHLSLLRSRAK